MILRHARVGQHHRQGLLIGSWLSLFVGWAVLTWAGKPACAAPVDREISQLFAEHCAACHGKNMEGGQTDSLLDQEWKHGGDDASLARIIRDGFEQNGMPPMKGLLTEPEIRTMVVYIREKGAQAAQKATSRPPPVTGQVVKSQKHSFKIRTFVEGLSTPWSMAFLPDDRVLVTELRGTLRVVENGKLLPEPIAGTPGVRAKGQGGLMEVSLHPGFSSNGWVYLAFTDPGTNSETTDGGMTEIVRGRIKDNRWTDEQTIFRAPLWTYRSTGVHFGCRLVFDKGYLFFSIGERGFMENAQDLSRPNGKIHRVFDDGRIPPDNPFVGLSNAVPSIWTFGNRNPQGLDQHPVTGELWETEHGPRGGDELNLVLKGRNYGWPIITHGMNYNGRPITGITAREGLEQPILHWTPSIAVCGIDFYDGNKFPAWKNDLFVTALAQEELRRLVIDGHQVVEQEVVLKGLGRVRDVASGPDGFLYVILNKPDTIIRLEPL